MVELAEESVLFLRVKPGTVDRAIREIRRSPDVREAEPTLGPYDIVVTGAFRDHETLQKFSEELEAKDYCEGCIANPSFEHWAREEVEKRPVNAWTLIKAVNVDKAFKALQKVENVQRLYSTPGEYNIIANITAEELSELQTTLIRDIHKIAGVKRTHTLTSARTE